MDREKLLRILEILILIGIKITLYIQSKGINNDFGVYDSQDELFKFHHQEMSKVKEFLYVH